MTKRHWLKNIGNIVIIYLQWLLSRFMHELENENDNDDKIWCIHDDIFVFLEENEILCRRMAYCMALAW